MGYSKIGEGNCKGREQGESEPSFQSPLSWHEAEPRTIQIYPYH
jgi:hypothetical protein